MTRVQTIQQPDSDCRWRIWRTHGLASKFATPEAAEHLCDGEFLWIAADTPDGTTWMIEDCPVPLMEVINEVPPAMVEWVIDQTMAGLGGVIGEMIGLEVGEDGGFDIRPVEPDDQDKQIARMARLMIEFMQFAHAATVLVDKLDSLHERLERDRGDGAVADRAAA